jgi:hypothetical protein
MRKTVLFLLFLFPFLLISSCKKEVDENGPTLEWVSPNEGQQYNVFDSIHVYFRLSDERALEYWNVKLVNQQLVPVLPTISQNVSGQHSEVGFDYPIDNIRITSGLYYVMVEASDGKNISRIFRSVNITEAPLELKGIFAVTQPMPSTVNLYKSDTTWAPSLLHQYSSDFSDLAVSNYWQQFYVAGSYFGQLRAESIDGQNPSWAQTPLASSNPYWGPMTVNGSSLWISVRGASQVRSLNESGTTTFHANADNNYYPVHHLKNGNRIFIEEKEISSSSRLMVVYSTAGAALQETPMNLDALTFFAKDADNLYVAGNDAGQGHLLIYDYATNGFWEPITLPAGLVTSACQLDTNTLVIGMDNGNLYRFTYSPVGLLSWASGINASQLRYDPAGDYIFTAEGSNVKIYDYNPFLLRQTISFPNVVADFELWYNR